MEKKKWIQEAIKHKGALRETAKKQHLIKGDEKLSKADLKKLESEGGKTAKQAHLAETLSKFEKGGEAVKNNDHKTFTPFVVKRLHGAEQITKTSKEKGGASLLTYEHYNAKLPIYKNARTRFDVNKAKEEFGQKLSKLSYSMKQYDFQRLMGELEVLGELIIKHEEDKKEKMGDGGMIVGRFYKDNTGKEYRYIGKDSEGNTLFNDGNKTIIKPLEDFDYVPKESKLFRFFKDGGKTASKEAKKTKVTKKRKMYGE